MAWYDVVDECWKLKIEEHGEPQYFSEQIEVDYSTLARALQREDAGPFVELVEPLSQGAFLVMRKAFSSTEVALLRKYSIEARNAEPSSFSKMLEGCTNFWRDITEGESKNYAIKNIKKTTYFFPWDPRSYDLYKLVNPRWRVAKLLSGLSPTMYESNTPKDGAIDRIQIVEYPVGSGLLEAHKDPKHNQRLIMSGYLSKQGIDYEGGGFWAQRADGEKRNLEESFETGDMGLCYAEVTHGVDPTNASNLALSTSGSRWFLGLYTNDSDEKSDRKTVRQVKLA